MKASPHQEDNRSYQAPQLTQIAHCGTVWSSGQKALNARFNSAT